MHIRPKDRREVEISLGETLQAKHFEEDKEYIASACKYLAIEFEPRSRCKDCYYDAAMQCLMKLHEATAKEDAKEDERKFILRPNLDVYFGNVRVNESTITDDLARELIAQGFDKKFFVKCE